MKTDPVGRGAADGAAVPGTGTTMTGASGAGAGASDPGHPAPVHGASNPGHPAPVHGTSGTTGAGRTPVGFGACGW